MNGVIGSHIKAVIFDFDDTLVATIEAKWASHKHVALKHYGKTLTDEDIRPHWGKPLKVLVGLLYGDDNIERALAFERTTNETFPKKIFDDTIRVLNTLRQSGKLLGLVTATTLVNLTGDLKHSAISEDLFDHIQTQDDTEFHKPDPRVFDPVLDWLSSMSIKPSEAVYVGDGLHDMQAALGAGLEFIGVATGLVTQKEFSKHNVPSIKKLGQLI